MSAASIRGPALAAALIAASQPVAAAECRPLDRLDAYDTDRAAPAEAHCSSYLTAAHTTGISCHWSFPFRSEVATDFGAMLWTAVTTCRTGTRLGPDALVNHPDSYDLREWASADGTYALSIKDKGALDRTLVFLRFEPN